MKRLSKVLVFVLTVALGIGACFAFTGCGGSDKTTIRVVTMFGEGDAHNAKFVEANNKFEADHTDVKIEDRSGNATDANWSPSVVNDMQSKNNVPDVLFFFNGVATSAFADQLIPVATIQAYDSNYGKNIKEMGPDPNCLPIKTGVQAIMYNTDVYSASDFNDYATFTAKMKANVADATKSGAVSADLPHYWLNHLLVKELGTAEYAALDGTKAFFTSAKKTAWATALKNSLNEMRALGFKEHAANGNAEEGTKFYGGTRAIAIDGQWVAGNVDGSAVKDKLAFAQFPGANEKFFVGGCTNGWFITKQAWNDEAKRRAAVDYIIAMTTDTVINDFCVVGGGIPTTGKAVSGAGAGALGFTSVMQGAKGLVAIDDRVPAAAKTALMGNFDTTAGAPKYLAQDGDVTIEQATELLEAFIAKLN